MYCNETAFEARFGSKELAELLPEGDSDDGRLYVRVAADADALIDSYLAARYTVPFSSPFPALIVGFAADLTRYELYDDAPPKEVAARRSAVISQLEALRDGKLTIPGLSPTSTTGGIAVSASDIVMTECKQSEYMGCL